MDQVETEPTPVLGDGISEQPHVRGLGAQVVGDDVGGHDLDLARHDPRTDEVGDLFEDVGENIVGDLGVVGVHTDYYRRSI